MNFEERNEIISKDSCNTQENSFVPERRYYIELFKKMPVGVLLTNKDHFIKYCNPAFTAIMGFDNDEIYGKHIEDVFCCSPTHEHTEGIIENIDNKTEETFICKWNTKLNIEKQIRCKKVDTKLNDPFFEITAWYIEDLTFSFENEEAFYEEADENGSKALIRRKLEIESAISFISSTLIAPENVDEAIVDSLERTGEICGASRAYLFRLHDDNQSMSNTHEWCKDGIGAQKDNLQDLPVDMFPWWMAKINRGEIIHIKEVASMPPEAAAEKEILEMQDINSLLVLPVHISGKVAGFIGLDNVKNARKWNMEDVVVLGAVANIMGSAIGQKEAEDELNRRNEKLKKAYDELKMIETMKHEFISNLSHELRTPLNSIQGYSELLLEQKLGNLNPKQKRSLKAVSNNSKRLGTLIDSLLYMGSVLAGKLDYHFDPVQMENIIDNAMHNYFFEAQKKNIEIKKEIAGKLPVIYGDVHFLPQLLYKLIDNSIKFTPEGGKITINGLKEDGGIHIEITDTGIGIPAENIDDIFKSFYQVDGSSTRRYGGNGLGLYIAKKIIEAHNGDISIQTQEGKGTVVHIFLPENAEKYKIQNKSGF